MHVTSLPALRRAALLALLCQALAGCMGVSTSVGNNLATAPPAAKQAPRLPVAFVIHPPPNHGRDDELAREKQKESVAWATALGDYAPPGHIYIASTSNPNNMPGELREFCRTHPVVDIYNDEDASREGTLVLTSIVAVPLDLASYGLLPLPVVEPYTARFRLTLPGDKPYTPVEADAPAPAMKQEYAYLRKETVSPLVLFPIGDIFRIYFVPPCSGCGGGLIGADDLSKWRQQEKRQLIARFMREAQPSLEQYTKQAESGEAAAHTP